MEQEKKCKKEKRKDKKIREEGRIKKKGRRKEGGKREKERLFAGGMREGLRSLEDTRDDEMLYMELVLRAKMRREFDKVLGPVQFAMSYREKVIIMSFPLKDHVLLLSAEKGINFAEIPFKVLKMLTH